MMSDALKKTRKLPAIPDTQTISLTTLKMIADPTRARLLGLFAGEPSTVQQVASQLNMPVTRLYYHVHLLEEHGLIHVVETRPVGGTIEKIYRASARQFIVNKDEFSGSGAKALKHTGVLIDFALTETGKAIRKSVKNGVIDLQQQAPHPQALQIRRGSGKISTSQAVQFYKRLEALVDEFTSLETQEDEQAEYLLALTFFPVSKPKEK